MAGVLGSNGMGATTLELWLEFGQGLLYNICRCIFLFLIQTECRRGQKYGKTVEGRTEGWFPSDSQ